MSVNKWAYEPEICDGDFCPGDCDYCSAEKIEKVMALREEKPVPRDYYEKVVSGLCEKIGQQNIEIERLRAELAPRGVYECFHCLNKSVIWDNDYTFEDLGYDGNGLVHLCHCASCGAEIEYRIPMEDDDEPTM